MSSENGKTVFEEAAAERELEELRLAIEETRARRRRANTAFDEFLKGFDERNRTAVPAPQPAGPPPRQQDVRAEAPNEMPQDQGFSAFEPAAAPTPAAPVAPSRPVDLSALDDFAQEEPFTESAPLRSIPAALAAARSSPVRRAAPLVGIAVVGLLAVFLWSRATLPGGRCPSRCRCRAAPCGRPRARSAGGCNLGNRNAAVSRDLDNPPGLAAGDRRRRAGVGEGSRGRDEDSAERRLADRHPRRRRRRGAGIDRGKGSGSVWTGGPAGDAKVYGETVTTTGEPASGFSRSPARRFLPIPSWSPSTRCRGSCCPPPCRCMCCRPP